MLDGFRSIASKWRMRTGGASTKPGSFSSSLHKSSLSSSSSLHKTSLSHNSLSHHRSSISHSHHSSHRSRH